MWKYHTTVCEAECGRQTALCCSEKRCISNKVERCVWCCRSGVVVAVDEFILQSAVCIASDADGDVIVLIARHLYETEPSQHSDTSVHPYIFHGLAGGTVVIGIERCMALLVLLISS